MNCPHCNTPLEMDAQFCGNCGSVLFTGLEGTTVSKTARTIQFSGFTWNVAESGVWEKHGPGPNWVSSSPKNVWVDSEGQLHLKITHDRDILSGRFPHGRWCCAGVWLERPLGYGTYDFFVDGRFDVFDPNVIAGLFLYKDDDHEIDIELGRWGERHGTNLQYVLQPASSSSISRCEAELNGDYSTHRIGWNPDSVSFRSAHGHYIGGLPSEHHLINQWTYGKAYHRPTAETVHINLWLYRGQEPMFGNETEIVIKRFAFQ